MWKRSEEKYFWAAKFVNLLEFSPPLLTGLTKTLLTATPLLHTCSCTLNTQKSIAFAWFFLLLPLFGQAQEGFDQTYTFEQIQALLNEGRDQKDLRKQALAWYKWAYYDEEHSGMSDSAFQYLARSAERFGRAGDSLACQRARADLADRLAARRFWDEAIQMQRGVLEYAQRTQNLYLETHLLARLNRIYLQKGDTAQATVLEKKFIAKNRILKDTALEISVLMQEAERLQQDRRHLDARYRAYRVLQMAHQINRADFTAWAEYTVGATSHWQSDYSNALRYLQKAMQSNPRTGDNLRCKIYRQLSLTYAVLDSLSQAQHYALRYGDLADTLLNRDRERSLQQLQARYDINDKRKQVTDLSREKNAAEEEIQEQRITAAALAIGLGAVLLALFFFVRSYRINQVVTAQNEELNRRHIQELEDKLKIETMQSMLAGQESERQRIAQDLHDSVGGLLAAAKIQFENISAKKSRPGSDEDFTKMKSLLDETVAETRHIARNMQPSALLEFGFVVAVRDLTGRVRGKSAPAITFHHIGDFSGLEQSVALNCYRIVQELLQNSLKHARAEEILVQLTQTDHQIALLVEDDGAGFDPAAVRKGMGTDNIARRVQFLKGELSVHSAPGKGTSTLVTVPL